MLRSSRHQKLDEERGASAGQFAGSSTNGSGGSSVRVMGDDLDSLVSRVGEVRRWADPKSAESAKQRPGPTGDAFLDRKPDVIERLSDIRERFEELEQAKEGSKQKIRVQNCASARRSRHPIARRRPRFCRRRIILAALARLRAQPFAVMFGSVALG